MASGRGWLAAAGPGGEAVVAAALALAMFVAGTARTPIMDRDEARFAEASREMLASGELVVPTFAGADRYDKPILIYWCTMAAYAVFGVGERAARLPSNVAGALVVLVVAWEARRRWGAGAGLLAGLLAAASLGLWMEAKACTADMVLLLPTLLAMLAFERILGGSARAGHVVVLWSALALAVLAKGPIAPAWVLMTAVALWTMQRRWRPWEVVLAAVLLLAGWWRLGPMALAVPLAAAGWHLLRSPAARRALRRLRITWGVPLFAALTLPWAVAAQVRTNGEFLRRAIGHHVVERSLAPFESHSGFPLFYLVTAVVIALPWFPALVAALGRRRDWRPTDERWRYLVAWILGPLVLIELVQTKLVHYWLPSYPAAVLLVTWWLLGGERDRRGAAALGRWLALAGGLLAAGLPLLVAVALPLPGLEGAAVGAGVVMAVAALLAAGWWRRRSVAATAVLGVGAALYLSLLACWYLPALGWRQLGPRLAGLAVAQRHRGDAIVVYRPRDDELYFYLPLDVVTCRSEECLGEWCRGGGSFLGLARTEDLERFRSGHAECRLKTTETLEGLDLAHGRWVRGAVFRPLAAMAPDPVSRAAPGQDVDRPLAGS